VVGPGQLVHLVVDLECRVVHLRFVRGDVASYLVDRLLTLRKSRVNSSSGLGSETVRIHVGPLGAAPASGAETEAEQSSRRPVDGHGSLQPGQPIVPWQE